MRQNSQIHLFLETEFKEKLEKEAKGRYLSLSELCRLKLGENQIEILKRIEKMVENLRL